MSSRITTNNSAVNGHMNGNSYKGVTDSDRMSATSNGIDSSARLLEDYRFVPYIESTPVTDPEGVAQQYATDLLHFVLHGVQDWIMKDEDENVPNRELLIDVLARHRLGSRKMLKKVYTSSPNFGLAKVYHSIFDLPVQKGMGNEIIKIFSASREAFYTDMVLSRLHADDILKPCIDIVCENTAAEKLAVTEFGAMQNAMYSRVASIMSRSLNKSIAYTVADTGSAAEFPPDVTFIKYDPEQADPVLSDSSVDLLILNHVLHKQHDVGGLLETFSRSVRPGGFLLVKEVTGSFALSIILEALVEGVHLPRVRGNRIYGRFLPGEVWADLFSQHGFDVIFKRSDGVCATLYLLRRRITPESTLRPVLFPVDDVHCSWLEDIQAKMKKLEHASSSNRLWLVAKKDVGGLVGLVNCLRLEPGGEKIRAICLSDLNTGDERATIHVDPFSPEIQSLAQKDLVFNIYRDGCWGSFRHIPCAVAFKDGNSSLRCEPEKSYIVVAGESRREFARKLLHWLAEKGAEHLVLCMSDQVSDLQKISRDWIQGGATLEISGCDVTTVDGAWGLINQAQKLGPLGGVFHLDSVLHDSLFQRQTRETFDQVCTRQAHATVNLDQVTRALCRDSLSMFVVTSSVSAGRGTLGQTNLGFACSIAERVCERRRADNLPGLAIQWGALAEDASCSHTNGARSAAARQTNQSDDARDSLLPQDASSCIDSLELFLAHGSYPVVSSVVRRANHKV